jgi:hypothetical protein
MAETLAQQESWCSRNSEYRYIDYTEIFHIIPQIPMLSRNLSPLRTELK